VSGLVGVFELDDTISDLTGKCNQKFFMDVNQRIAIETRATYRHFSKMLHWTQKLLQLRNRHKFVASRRIYCPWKPYKSLSDGTPDMIHTNTVYISSVKYLGLVGWTQATINLSGELGCGSETPR
jgi:hypothetical protein